MKKREPNLAEEAKPTDHEDRTPPLDLSDYMVNMRAGRHGAPFC